ncbi:hypothetical protein POTOM_048026 [Populus tomentosa]|uniref:RING-type E3 ubiquitin transferase n=1 Tax=Populus tomentosa TaxID=118781 RepID=A0A8X7YDK3_POPTO|nr:hypothetical protein POTOM_048026 [Populus tomentosa]
MLSFEALLLTELCPPALEEHGSLTSHNGAASAFTAGLLVELHLNTSTPDTFRPPPAPLPYDVILGCPQSPYSESVQETISRGSFGTLATSEDLDELDCKTQASSLLVSPRKSEVTKLHEPVASATEEEDACPICLEGRSIIKVVPEISQRCLLPLAEYDLENPKHITNCEHHFHLSCILEWMERSDTCPICDQVEAHTRGNIYFTHASGGMTLVHAIDTILIYAHLHSAFLMLQEVILTTTSFSCC